MQNRGFILFLFATVLNTGLYGQITNVRVTDATPTAAVLRFVASGCQNATVIVSESSSLTPLVFDVDPTLFTNANLVSAHYGTVVNGNDCAMIIGEAHFPPYAPLDVNGKSTSRSLQKNTLHYGSVTLGGSTQTFRFRTADLMANNSYNMPAPVDPINPARIAWPNISWNQGDNDTAIDPQTGILMKFGTRRRTSTANFGSFFEFAYAYAGGATCANGGGWTNPCNVLADDTAFATYTNTLSPQSTLRLMSTFFFDATSLDIDDVSLNIKGHFADGTTGDDLKLQVCISIDQVNCYGPWVTTPPLPTASTDTGAEMVLVATDFLQGSFLNLNQQMAYGLINNQSGIVNTSGAVVSAIYGHGIFPPEITALNARIYIGGVDVAHEFTVIGVTNGVTISVNPSAGVQTRTTFQYPHFGFLFRKLTSSASLLTLQYARVVLTEYARAALAEGAGYTQICDPTLQPSGWTLTNCTNTSPISCHTGQAHGYSTGDKVTITNVAGNTAANVTNNPIIVTGTQDFTLNGTTGNGAYDGSNLTGLVTRIGDPYGYECQFINGGSPAQRYWFEPTKGIRRYEGINSGVGYNVTNGDTFRNGGALGAGGFIATIGQYTYIQSDQGNIYRVQFNGNGTFGWNQDVGACSGPGGALGGAPCNSTYDYFTNTVVTPWITNLYSLITAFDSNWNSNCLNLSPGIQGIVNDNGTTIAVFSGHLGNGPQNTLSCFGYLDLVNKQVLATGNSWQAPGARFQESHDVVLFPGMDRAVVSGLIPFGDAIYTGPYGAQYTSGAINATPTACPAQLTALSLPNSFNTTNSDLCTTVTVAAQPNSILGASPHNPNANWLAGDWPNIFSDSSLNFGTAEFTQSVGVSGLQLVLKRNTAINTISSHPAGGYIVAGPTAANAQTAFNIGGSKAHVSLHVWDWRHDPHMTNSSCPSGPLPWTYPYTGQFISQGCTVGTTLHQIDAGHPGMFGDPSQSLFRGINDSGGNNQDAAFNGLCAYGIVEASTAAKVFWNGDKFYCAGGIPSFSGTTGVHNGEDVQSHSNMNGFASRNPGSRDHFGDTRQFIFTPALTSLATPISGNVYKVTGLTYQGVVTYDPKRSVVYGFAGPYQFYEISGPGVMLVDDSAHLWNSCIVYVAGECWAGSQVSEIYIICPQCNPWPVGDPSNSLSQVNQGLYTCPSAGGAAAPPLRTICFSLYASVLDKYVRYPLYGRHDYNMQAVSHFLAGPYENSADTRELPDSSWVFNSVAVNRVRYEPLMAKVGDMPMETTTNGSEFIPITIPVPARRNATRAYVVFGYGPEQFCNSLNRREQCVSNYTSFTAGITNPFWYKTSDTWNAVSCASGCNIVVPTLAQKIMHYNIVWTDNSNNILATGPIQVMATP